MVELTEISVSHTHTHTLAANKVFPVTVRSQVGLLQQTCILSQCPCVRDTELAHLLWMEASAEILMPIHSGERVGA